jgi:class 3 adenylate cyclase
MKQLLTILLLLPLPCLAGGEMLFDTIKSKKEKELLAAATVQELRQAIIELRAAEKEDRQPNLYAACLKIGGIYSREQYFAKAITYYRRALILAEKSEDRDEQLSARTLLANALLKNGQALEAHDAFLLVLEKHRADGNYEKTLLTLQRLADACNALKNFTKACEYYSRIIDLANQKGDLQHVATALNNLGFAANQNLNYPLAVQYFNQADSVARIAGTKTPGYVFTNLGIAYNNLGQSTRSIDHLHRAEEQGGKEVEKSYVRHLTAVIYLKNDDIYNALRYNELAIDDARRSKNASVMCDAYDVASRIYQQLFEYDKALDFYKKHLALKDSLMREDLLQKRDFDNLHSQMEDMENQLFQFLADEELRRAETQKMELRTQKLELENETQRLEAARRLKEVELLEREQEVRDAQLKATRLLAEKTRQELQLKEKELLATRQQREIKDINQKRQLDSLIAARQAAAQEMEITQLENQKQINELKLQQQEQFRQSAYRLGILGAVIMLIIFGSWLYGKRLNKRLANQNRQIEAQKEEIDLERNRAENLLLNILPGEVAQELKLNGAATPRQYRSATVLFTDFVGFTRIASGMTPGEVIQELNTCFLAFDEIVERYNLEKIKTMGDSYMCVGGVPVERNSHPTDAVSAALEILAFMHRFNRKKIEAGNAVWQIRIGIHTGEVVAGVVGSKKFAYDIWGDTVNVASRMENNCPPDHVNISEATHRLVSQSFPCEFRGEVEVKNKGRMGMYLVRA